MNFACLSKLTIGSTNHQEYMQQVQLALRSKPYPGLVEMAFYLADKAPHQLYSMSLWYTLQQSLDASEDPMPEPLSKVQAHRTIINRLYFKLAWEHRIMNEGRTNSFISLLTFPVDYPDETIIEGINYIRSQRRQIPGLVGSWIGRPINTTNSPPKQLLVRKDWNSLQAQNNYFESELFTTIVRRYGTSEIKVEYANFNQEIVMQAKD